jgi:hypothetical protein
MKRRNYIRRILYNNGYTSNPNNEYMLDFSGHSYAVTAFTYDLIDTDGYLIYTDPDGNVLKARYDTTTPIAYNTITTTISFASTVNIAGQNPYTYQFAIINQQAFNVTNECSFTSSVPTKATAASTGLITAVASGTTTISIVHNDGPSGTSSITVGQVNTSLNPLGGTIANSSSTFSVSTGTTYYLPTGVTIKNNNSQPVTISTATLVYTWGNTNLGTITGYNLTTLALTGSTTLTITDSNANKSVSYTVNIV